MWRYIEARKRHPGTAPALCIEGQAMKDEGVPYSTSDLLARVLGIPLRTFALISLTHKVFKIGLAPVLQSFVEFWRHFTEPLSDILKHLWSLVGITIPQWYSDAYILSFIIMMIYIKNLHDAEVIKNGWERNNVASAIVTLYAFLASLLSSIIFFGLLFGITFFGSTSTEKYQAMIDRGVRRDVIATIAITVAFFALNVAIKP